MDVANQFREGKKFVVLKTKDDGKMQIKVFASAKEARDFAGMSIHLIFYVGKMISGSYAENTPVAPTSESVIESFARPDFSGEISVSFTLSSGTSINYKGRVDADYDIKLDDETGEPVFSLVWKKERNTSVRISTKNGDRSFDLSDDTDPAWDELYNFLDATGDADELEFKLDDAIRDSIERQIL